MLYKAFNWSCTHGHTHITSVHTERISQLFSRWRFGRLIGLRIPERETVSITKTIFTYGFISLVSPRSQHAIQFRSVSWRTLIERPAYELTAKSKFRPEPWKLSENTGILRKTRGRWQRNNQRGRGVIAPIAFSAVSPLLFACLRLKISRPWTYSALKYRKEMKRSRTRNLEFIELGNVKRKLGSWEQCGSYENFSIGEEGGKIWKNLGSRNNVGVVG